MLRTLPLLLLLVAACGPGPSLYVAEPATADTVVDGDLREWPTALRPVPSESGLGIGLRRDGDDLVVAIVASDERQARRIVLGGLTVWVDPGGGTDRALGLRYPAPPALDADQMRRQRLEAQRGETPDAERLRRRFDDATAQIQVTRGVVTQRAATDGRFGGLEAAADWGRRGLAVEMRVPLAVTPGLLTEAPTGAVSLGIELIDVQRPVRNPRGARGSGPAQGPLPTARERPGEDDPMDVPTITRWLRIDL